MKNFFFASHANLPFFRLKLLPFLPSLCFQVRVIPLTIPVSSLQVLKGWDRGLPRASPSPGWLPTLKLSSYRTSSSSPFFVALLLTHLSLCLSCGVGCRDGHSGISQERWQAAESPPSPCLLRTLGKQGHLPYLPFITDLPIEAFLTALDSSRQI